MALSSGVRFGDYEIAGEIGAGGMGVVYRATDTTLERDVAIKVLPESMAADAERIARFDREAKTLAALNHPNIAQIYGLERSEATTALVMELVEGPTLADRIEKGAIPADEALGIALQIAEALEAAHEQGIIHRDLKPANIKLRPDGTVKVLDFGIAKALESENLTTGPQSPMMTTPATMAGVILGTAAYMSPEQAKGKAIDQRTDIWAFGCVLYEMLTGQFAFGAEDVPTTLARVIERDTDIDSLPADVSPAVRQTIKVCLQKDPRKRVRDIGDVRLALEGAFESATPLAATAATVAVPLWRRAVPIVAAVLITGVVVGLAGEMLRREATLDRQSVNVKRTNINIGVTEPIGNTALPAHVALSPDGQRLAYVAEVGGTTRLYLRALDQLEAQPMPGTDRAHFPYFSPDGEWLVFHTDTPAAAVKKISVQGGPPQTLADANYSSGSSWVVDDTIVYGTGAPGIGRKLYRIPANGGVSEVLIEPEPNSGHVWPEVLPGGDAVLYSIRSGPEGSAPIRDGSIAVISLETGEIRNLINQGHTPRYSPTGHILFARSGALWAVPFDVDSLDTTGSEVPVVDNVAQDGLLGGAAFTISTDGMLVYAPGGDRDLASGTSRYLAWVDREGQESALAIGAQEFWNPRLAPDGQRLAVSVYAEGNEDLWIIDIVRGTSSRITFNTGPDLTPLWSPDGQRIALWSVPYHGHGGLFILAADGTGEAERLTTSDVVQIPESFSPDGAQLIFRHNQTGSEGLHVLSLDDDRLSQPLIDGAFFEGAASISPNGRWIAYHSNESGQSEVYVRPFPNVEDGKWQISIEGGQFPRWGSDDSELFFRAADAMLAVNVETGDVFSAGDPEGLFAGPYWTTDLTSSTYDISPDGQRFLMMRLTGTDERASGQTELVAVENWFEELERLAPPSE